MNYRRSIYTASLLTLTKNFCNDLISVDEFKCALTELCKQYRKDKYYGKS